MLHHTSDHRYVQLTETGRYRFEAVRRRCKVTLDDIVGDMNTPSINTVKRALRQGAVFVSTLERIWDYFERCAKAQGETLSYLAEGKDYVFLESTLSAESIPPPQPKSTDKGKESQTGWISRHVPRPNRLFTGRRETLQRLHAALQLAPATPVPDPQALTGLGGIGKTQTAVAYIYEYWRDYTHVFWVSAETAEMLNEGLAGLAEELALAAAPMTKQQALAVMHEWLRREAGWLLVLDNADDLETLAPSFPRHHTGHLLFTTRARNPVRWASPIPLTRFGRQEGALLLLRRAGILDVHETLDSTPADTVQAAEALCDELGGLPLALDQAGAYLSETTRTIRDYHALYCERGLRLLDSVTDGEHASVTITFTMALEQLMKRSVYGTTAVEMMRLCAFLAPDAIPDAIFLAYRFDRDTQDPSLEGNERYDAICAAMCGYSLATRNPQDKTLTVHRLVQRATRETMSPEENRLWIERAVQAVADATPEIEFEYWPLCDLLMPQWRVCVDYIRDGILTTASAAHLVYQAGRYLRARALYADAESFLQLALTLAETVYGVTHPIIADYLDEIACLFRVLDRRDDAERLHRRAVAILENAHGPEHPQVASKLHNMALLYVQYDEYATAEAPFVRALAIYEAQPAPDHLLIATTLTQLAGVYRTQKRFAQAERCCRRALETYERHLDPNHVFIATGYNNLALLYLTMERYEDAEAFYLRALTLYEQAYGPEHPENGAVVWGLARVYWKQGRLTEADDFFRRVVHIYTKHFGPDHARSVKITDVYADFQKETGHSPTESSR